LYTHTQTHTYISCDLDILVYKLLELLEKCKHTGISKGIVDTMSRSYARASHPNLWGIPIYAYSQTWYHSKNIPKHYISTNSTNVISQSYMHTWHSEPLENSCNTCTPNTCHLIEWKCKLDYHYTYVFHPIPENICILICLAWNPSSKSCHTSPCYACSCYVSLFLCRKALTPRLVSVARSINFLKLMFLMPLASTLWSYTCSAYEDQPQSLFTVHDFVMLVHQQ
jgi:hypothetical protein